MVAFRRFQLFVDDIEEDGGIYKRWRFKNRFKEVSEKVFGYTVRGKIVDFK